MDQLSAHLDRGWDLAQKGDAPGAVACARRAFELDPQSQKSTICWVSAQRSQVSRKKRSSIIVRRSTLDETYLEAMLERGGDHGCIRCTTTKKRFRCATTRSITRKQKKKSSTAFC